MKKIKAGIASEINENFRKVALSIIKARGEQRLTSVLFSSATNREGKTTVILNVAQQLRDNYGLVPLVIEMNDQKSAFSRFLDLEHNQQVVEKEKMSIQKCIVKSPSGIGFLFAGQVVCSAAGEGPVSSSLLERILGEVEGFDVVLIDIPSILKHTDVVTASTITPNLILVVEAGKTSYEMLHRVKRELDRANIVLLGTILNKHKRCIPGWIYRWLVR